MQIVFQVGQNEKMAFLKTQNKCDFCSEEEYLPNLKWVCQILWFITMLCLGKNLCGRKYNRQMPYSI